MCSSPKIPPPPPPPQEVKQPETMNERRRQRQANPNAMGGGTLLTGPSGVASSGMNLGGSTLLGG